MISTAIIAGFVAFVTTNFDDIFILIGWFSQQGAGPNTKYIVFGQYLGFASIVVLSIVGSFCSTFIPKEWIGLLGFVPIYIGIAEIARYLRRNNRNSRPSKNLRNSLSSEASPKLQVFEVAVVTFANGGDNIAIYLPLFVGKSTQFILTILLVFLILVAVWCYVGHKLVNQRTVGKMLKHYGNILQPFGFVCLGMYILVTSGALGLVSGLK